MGMTNGRYVTLTGMKQEVVIPPSKTLSVATRDGILVPRVIASAGDKAARRFLEFFAATIRNKNTRMAYYHACVRFFAWCDHHKIGEIADIEQLHVAAYVEALGKDFEKPTGHCQTKFYTACSRTRVGWSSAVFAHELPPRSAGFDSDNGLYLFALSVPALWPADSAVSETFFVALYESLAAGASIVQSFGAAQRIARGRYPAYRDWGVFVLFG